VRGKGSAPAGAGCAGGMNKWLVHGFTFVKVKGLHPSGRTIRLSIYRKKQII
jgi:hypothetical protein